MAKTDTKKRGCFAVYRQFCQSHRQTRFLWASWPRAEQKVARACVEQGTHAFFHVMGSVRTTPLHDVHIVAELHDGVSDVVGERIQVVNQHHGPVRAVSSLSKAATKGGAVWDVQRRDAKPSSCAGAG